MATKTSYSCSNCGKLFMTVRGSYCSSACRQMAYRERKKQMKTARANTRSMDLYMMVDELMTHIHYESKDLFNAKLWSLLDRTDTNKQKIELVSLVRHAVMVSGCI